MPLSTSKDSHVIHRPQLLRADNRFCNTAVKERTDHQVNAKVCTLEVQTAQ